MFCLTFKFLSFARFNVFPLINNEHKHIFMFIGNLCYLFYEYLYFCICFRFFLLVFFLMIHRSSLQILDTKILLVCGMPVKMAASNSSPSCRHRTSFTKIWGLFLLLWDLTWSHVLLWSIECGSRDAGWPQGLGFIEPLKLPFHPLGSQLPCEKFWLSWWRERPCGERQRPYRMRDRREKERSRHP